MESEFHGRKNQNFEMEFEGVGADNVLNNDGKSYFQLENKIN